MGPVGVQSIGDPEAALDADIDPALIDRLKTAYDEALQYIGEFVCTTQFHLVMAEMWEMPREERHQFVLDVWLNPDALRERGVVVPPDLVVQRSAFGDERPTLFCVVKKLPPGLIWEKATITFDQPDGRCEGEISLGRGMPSTTAWHT